MKAQQLLDHIIVPTLKYMGGNYDSLNARMLMLVTAAIESNCGYYIKQIGGPALGIWQMEPNTYFDIWINNDAIGDNKFGKLLIGMTTKDDNKKRMESMVSNPMYSCAMARLKYAMDPKRLPDHNDKHAMYAYYKRIYNTELGASTWDKFLLAFERNQLSKVKLS